MKICIYIDATQVINKIEEYPKASYGTESQEGSALVLFPAHTESCGQGWTHTQGADVNRMNMRADVYLSVVYNCLRLITNLKVEDWRLGSYITVNPFDGTW